MKSHDKEKVSGLPSASEEIDVWERVLTTTEDSNIHLPRDYSPHSASDVEEVKVWIAIQQVLMRQEITRQIMNLYKISYIVGLVDFVFTQNTWLLATFGLLPFLTLLLRWIVGYWFQQPKQ